MTQPASPKKLRKTSSTTIIVSSLAGIALLAFLIYALTRGSSIREYNRLMDLINDEKHAEAQKGLEDFLQKDPPPDLRKNAMTELAKLYAQHGDDPALSFAQSRDWYRKADQFDPSSLNVHQRTVLTTPTPVEEPTTQE